MTARIRVESGGRLVPDAEAKGELDARRGSFLLLPTAPDLLAALRQPAEGGRGKGPRVVVMGDASGFPLSDLIAFLSQSRWTGALRLHAPGGERSVVLKDGEVRGATSEDPADRLWRSWCASGTLRARTSTRRSATTRPAAWGGRWSTAGFSSRTTSGPA